MLNKPDGIYSKILILGTLMFLVGCVSDPVPTNLPANHPSNPAAAEAVFTATPNPFADRMSIHEMKPMETPPMSHGGHTDQQSHKMKPAQNNNEKSKKTKTEESGHRH
jgi:hypothetical protein